MLYAYRLYMAAVVYILVVYTGVASFDSQPLWSIKTEAPKLSYNMFVTMTSCGTKN